MTRLRLTAALAAAALLGACQIGTYVNIGPGDDPPSVSLAASPALASRGETVGLVAAAADDYLVAEVAFYRLDTGGTTLLGRDTSAPYALETVLPTGAIGEVRYISRAVDDAGQVSESQAAIVAVR